MLSLQIRFLPDCTLIPWRSLCETVNRGISSIGSGYVHLWGSFLERPHCFAFESHVVNPSGVSPRRITLFPIYFFKYENDWTAVLTKNNVTELTLANAATRTGYSTTVSAFSRSPISCVALNSCTSLKVRPFGKFAYRRTRPGQLSPRPTGVHM